jgi:hypothetical protein
MERHQWLDNDPFFDSTAMTLWVDRVLGLLALRLPVQGRFRTTLKAMNRMNKRGARKIRHRRNTKRGLPVPEGLVVHHEGHLGRRRGVAKLVVARQLERRERKRPVDEDVRAGLVVVEEVADEGEEEVHERDEGVVVQVAMTFGEHSMNPTKKVAAVGTCRRISVEKIQLCRILAVPKSHSDVYTSLWGTYIPHSWFCYARKGIQGKSVEKIQVCRKTLAEPEISSGYSICL